MNLLHLGKLSFDFQVLVLALLSSVITLLLFLRPRFA